MTQIYDYTKRDEPVSEKKPIEFVMYINDCGNIKAAGSRPQAYDYVARISAADPHNEYDIFEAWNDAHVYRFLGHYNDGVINETD